jgi:hypothetical protein
MRCSIEFFLYKGALLLQGVITFFTSSLFCQALVQQMC